MKHIFTDQDASVWYCTGCSAPHHPTLTSDCPGRHLTHAEIDAVHAGTIDFVDGVWVGKAPASPKPGALAELELWYQQAKGRI